MRACSHCGYGWIHYGYLAGAEPHRAEVSKVVGLTGLTKSQANTLLKESEGEIYIRHVEAARGCNVPPGLDAMDYQFAAEGYWGF